MPYNDSKAATALGNKKGSLCVMMLNHGRYRAVGGKEVDSNGSKRLPLDLPVREKK
jgi:hypothetical protein